MIDFQAIVIILTVHFLADFALQTHEQASLKSTSDKALLEHVLGYSAVWLFISYGILGTWYKPIIFAFITYICHFNTDYHTSRVVKRLFEKRDYHNGFVVVGADQVLHYMQLFLTYLLLS